MTTSDALVIGGGLSGLCMANALAHFGLSATVVERGPLVLGDGPVTDGRTTAISLSAKRMLDQLGLWQVLAQDACPILDIRVSDGPSRLFLHYDHRDVGDDPMGFIVDNTALHQSFLAGAQARETVTLIGGTSVEHLERQEAGVWATLSDGSQINAPLAIAADGRFSPTRAAAGIRTSEHDYRQSSMVCTVSHPEPHHNIAHERFLPGGPMALLPMQDNHCSVVWSEETDLAKRLMELDDERFAAELTKRFGDALGPLTLIGRRWVYPLSLCHAERYVDRRLALVGDAAHAIHPIAGQGFNLGLRDIAALAEVLGEARDLGLDFGSVTTLARYQRWRGFDSAALIVATDALNRLFSTDFQPVRMLRGLGLAAVNRTPALKKIFMRHAMGTVGELPKLLRTQ
jgi:2-octaprenyl-6-methoxyphenol hydroxylase